MHGNFGAALGSGAYSVPNDAGGHVGRHHDKNHLAPFLMLLATHAAAEGGTGGAVVEEGWAAARREGERLCHQRGACTAWGGKDFPRSSKNLSPTRIHVGIVCRILNART